MSPNPRLLRHVKIRVDTGRNTEPCFVNSIFCFGFWNMSHALFFLVCEKKCGWGGDALGSNWFTFPAASCTFTHSGMLLARPWSMTEGWLHPAEGVAQALSLSYSTTRASFPCVCSGFWSWKPFKHRTNRSFNLLHVWSCCFYLNISINPSG